MSDIETTKSCCPQSSVNRHGRKQRVYYTTVNMAPCRICGGKSTGYHFGVVSCEACKAFFRRAIARNPKRHHVCQKGTDCRASQPGKINNCYGCRYKRCIESGMSKNSIRQGRFSTELRTKSILDASRYKDQLLKQECEQIQEQLIAPKTQNTLSNPPCKSDDTHQVSGTNSSFPERFSPCVEKSSTLKSVLESDTELGLTNQEDSLMIALSEGCSFCLDVECRSKNSEAALETIQPSLDLEPGLNLSNRDQQNLEMSVDLCQGTFDINKDVGEDERTLDEHIHTLVLLQNTLYPQFKVTEDILLKQKIIEREHQQREEAFLFMFGTTEYASSRDFKEVLSEVNIELDDRLIRFREKAHATETSIVNYIYHSKFIPGFKQLNKEDVSKLLKASYFEFWIFSNFATMNENTGVAGGTDVVINGHKKVIKTFLPKDHVDVVFRFCLSLQKLDLSLEEVSIIRAIILTIADRSSLKEPHKVDCLNQMFIRCLQYHLRKSTAKSSRRFYKIFDRLIAVRSLVHKNRQTNVQFLREWGFLMEDFPLWKEMMLSQLSPEQRADAMK